MVKVKIL